MKVNDMLYYLSLRYDLTANIYLIIKIRILKIIVGNGIEILLISNCVPVLYYNYSNCGMFSIEIIFVIY